MKKSILCMFVCFIIVSVCLYESLFYSEAVAEELTATITNIVGVVEVVRAGEVTGIPATEGMKLYVGDTVKTGDDSSARLTFLPKAVIYVTDNVELKIEEHMLHDTTNAIKSKLDLITGRLMAIIDDLPPDSAFDIVTPTAVAAVRGTKYYVGSDGQIYVEEGAVIVINRMTGEEFVVSAGQLTVIREDGTVLEPREATPGEIEDMANDFVPLEAEPYEPPERPGIVITPVIVDPYEEPASDF